MLFVLGCPAGVYVVRATISTRGLCFSCKDVPQESMMFVLEYPAVVNVVRARISRRGLCCSC